MNARDPRRWWALGALVLAVVAIGLDATVLNLALPILAGSLQASEEELQWFVTAYSLALAAVMLPAGLIGDRYGRKTVMMVALLVFGLASAACAYSPAPLFFIAARVVLGAAGAAIIVMSLAVVTVLFDETERPRAVGVWAAGNFLSMPLGPIVGGWMLSHFWWGWVFLMNLPVTLLGIGVVLVFIPQSRSEKRPGIDLLGVLLSSAGLAALMYGITEAGSKSWTDSAAAIPSLAAVALIAAFVAWEAWLTRRPGGEPLVDLSLFRSRAFSSGMLLGAVGIFGMFGVLFLLPQLLGPIMHMDAQATGFRFLPAIAGLLVGALPSDRVAARFGAATTVAVGFVILSAGLFAGSTMSASSGDGFIAGWTFVVGVGAGMGLGTAASAAIVELSAERSGVGSGLFQAVVKLGPAFGATILGSVLNSTYQARVDVSGVPAQLVGQAQQSVMGGLTVAAKLGSGALARSVSDAFVAGIDDAIRAAAIACLVAAGAALVLLPHRVAPPAAATEPRAGALAGGSRKPAEPSTMES